MSNKLLPTNLPKTTHIKQYQKHLYIQATFRHVSLPPTTTITTTINIGEETPLTNNISVYRLFSLSWTHTFISRPLLHRACFVTLPTSMFVHGQHKHSGDGGQFVCKDIGIFHPTTGCEDPEEE
jgi:hypothetical protein